MRQPTPPTAAQPETLGAGSGGAATAAPPRGESAPSRTGGATFAGALLVAAANLRPAVASVGPVLEDIRADLGLSAAAASVLTALPVLCFGAGAFVAPRLARRFGSETTLVAVLGLVTLGQLLRLWPSEAALFTGTFLAGAAIAVANVLIPALVKRDFRHRTGLMMGLYVGVTVFAGSVAAGLTVPLGRLLGMGWRGGLGVWAAPAAVAFALWLALTAARRRRSVPDDRSSSVPASLLRDPVAWQVTVFMGLQSLGFYTLLSWLPSVYRSYGASPDVAGQLLSVMIFLGVPTALVVPSLVTRSARQSWWAVTAAAVTAVGMLGLLLAPLEVPHLWAVLLGVGTGASFPLALTLIVLRSPSSQDAAQLSAMSQGAGYGLAAVGPFFFGLVHDVSGGWTLPLVLIVLVLVPQSVVGFLAGRPTSVRQGGRA